MKLKNTFIFTGNYTDLKSLREDLLIFKRKKKESDLSKLKESKYIKNMVVGDLNLDESNYYQFGIHFEYKLRDLTKLINYFSNTGLKVIYLCESSRANVWIVRDRDDILNYKLIPHFAAVEIIADYIDYTEHNIITDDHYNTIKLQGNKLVYNDHPMTKREVRDFFHYSSVNNKPVSQLLEQFIFEYYGQSINEFDQIPDSSNSHTQDSSERTSLLSLILVSVSIFIILFLISFMTGII
ncbi:hypothetical protein [Haloplasma contractile]|uniref:Uncharacterized protein n=1 Tax=Haloplasma contractile SSD-17B TaxID=1033810 RepID=F7PWL3_9MOLU|nr:hypothetical protein [Haloplasma contractile]ERJ12616.1 hypothetical protein HLPCO_001607 [Haloplasma contractile SSD-17B]